MTTVIDTATKTNPKNTTTVNQKKPKQKQKQQQQQQEPKQTQKQKQKGDQEHGPTHMAKLDVENQEAPPSSPKKQPSTTPNPQQQSQQPSLNQEPKDTQRRTKAPANKKGTHTNTNVQFDNPQKRKQAARKKIVQMNLSLKQSSIFSHLPQYDKPSSLSLAARFTDIHPAIISLGLKYANKIIQGSTARCLAMLDALEIMIQDQQIDPEKKFSVDLDAKLKPTIQFLSDCRPLSVVMGNAILLLKRSIVKFNVDPTTSDSDTKQSLIDDVRRFRKNLLSAGELIDKNGVQKIYDHDVIMVYSASSVVENILCHAHRLGKRFEVIVVDSNPKYEGRTLLNRLVRVGVKCTYGLISSVSYLIKEATKVFLGAHSLLSNGAVISRTGSAVVAMMAHANNIPVLVACETLKFVDRAQLDSICWNELENPDDIIVAPFPSLTPSTDSSSTPSSTTNKQTTLPGWRDIDKLILLNLAYDLTPMDHVSVVVTEIGLIPPTSVPVVIREAKEKSDVLI